MTWQFYSVCNSIGVGNANAEEIDNYCGTIDCGRVLPWLYYQFRVPDGVTPKGDSSDTIALLGLIGGIVSLLTSIVGLLQKIVDLRASAKSK